MSKYLNGIIPPYSLLALEDLPIEIVSGEGEQGSAELYTGKRTLRAIKARLTRERSVTRWARACIYTHTNQAGAWSVDVETGEAHGWAGSDQA